VPKHELDCSTDKTNLKLRDESIIEKITTEEELSGILNWALIGYYRLMENTYFTESRSTEEIKEIYLEMSDPINAFINAMIIEEPEAVVETQPEMDYDELHLTAASDEEVIKVFKKLSAEDEIEVAVNEPVTVKLPLIIALPV
jgi:phage/plasmid-associated DNA primase